MSIAERDDVAQLKVELARGVSAPGRPASPHTHGSAVSNQPEPRRRLSQLPCVGTRDERPSATDTRRLPPKPQTQTLNPKSETPR